MRSEVYKNTAQHFISVDMLRGIAILMVIFVHNSSVIAGIPSSLLGEISRYGRMGVQLFFIASAFTLCYTFENRPNEPIRNFYIRRYFRIAPLYYLGIILYVSYWSIRGIHGGNGIPDQYTTTNILANFLLLNGLYPPANNNIVPGGWSIGTEILFYLVFPFIFNLTKYLQKKYKYFYFMFPFVCLLISLTIQYVYYLIFQYHVTYDNFLYFSLLNQFPVFSVGISMYFAYTNGFIQKIKIKTNIILIMISTSISLYLFYYGLGIFNFALVPFISALSFLFLFILLENLKNLKENFISKIGVLSYACYIIHFIPAVIITGRISYRYCSIHPILAICIFYTGSVVCTYIISKYINKFIERRFINLGKILIKKLSANS